jgi:hypothetical protein
MLTPCASVRPGIYLVWGIEADSRPRPQASGGAMSKVAPYHSNNPSDPDVYHDHDDCPTGKQIPSWNKKPGKNGWRQCKDCEQLD